MVREGIDPAAFAVIDADCFDRPWRAADFIQRDDRFGISLCHGVLVQGYVYGSCVAEEAELLRIAVTPSSRNGGIGTRLIMHFLELSGRRGARNAFLEVSSVNAAAIALYRRTGWSRVGVRPNYYNQGEDALVFHYRLD